jgi:conjugative transfer relaxase protein TraI
MLTLTPLSHPTRAAQYYLIDDGGLSTAGYWYGELAKAAGLAQQPIDAGIFLGALRGHWRGEATLGRRGAHAPGLDVTFSAPKSLSLLALLAGDPRLRHAHDVAVRYALTELERDVAQTRVQSQGQLAFVDTSALLIAVFEHTTSRSGDPQLHSHAVIANMTRLQQGPLRALASCTRQRSSVINGTFERLYAHQKYYSALYHGHLAKTVTSLGYRLAPRRNHTFDIVGVPRTVIDAFSTRRARIQQWERERGLNSAPARDLAALCTRAELTTERGVDRVAQWQARLETLGYTPDTLKQSCHQRAPSVNPALMHEAEHAVHLALKHLSRFQTALSLEHIVECALDRFSQTPSLRVQDIQRATETLVRQRTLIALPTPGHYTTADLLLQEQALLERSKRQHAIRGHVPSLPTLKAMDLSPSQQQCLTSVIRSTRPFHLIEVTGRADTMSARLTEAFSASGARTHLLFARRGEQRAWQARRRSPVCRGRALLTQLIHPVCPEVTRQFLAHSASLGPRDVIVIDDARQLSANQLRRLSDAVTQTQSKLILIERPDRRPSHWSNNALALFRRGQVLVHPWRGDDLRPSRLILTDNQQWALSSRLLSAALDPRWEIRATTRSAHEQLTRRVRELLITHGHLRGQDIELRSEQRHWLSPSERTLAKHYRPGMGIRWRYDGQWLQGRILHADTTSNSLTIRRHTTPPTTLTLSTQANALTEVQLTTPQPIAVLKGEQLIATSDDPHCGLVEGVTYRVVCTSAADCVLKSRDGARIRLSVNSAKCWPLSYHYLAGPNDPHPRPCLLYVSPTHRLSRTLLDTLLPRYRRIDIHTDQCAKAHQRLLNTELRPSAIEHLMSPNPRVDRYLDTTTADGIVQDIRQAIRHIAPTAPVPVAEQAVAFALAHSTVRHAAFRQHTLVIEAIRFALSHTREGLTLSDITIALEKHRTALSRAFQDGTRWTTSQALTQERAIFMHLQNEQQTQTPLATPEGLERLLNARPHLTRGQRQALQLIASHRDRFVAVQGLAGTGKSTLLRDTLRLVRDVHQDLAPHRLLGVAPTRSAVRELKKQGLPATTLAQCLTNYRTQQTSAATFHRSLFFLDECAMLGNAPFLAFIRLVIDSHSRAVLLGDHHQLLALGAGKPFALAIERGWLETAYLYDIVRQRTPTLRRAVQQLVDGQPRSALASLHRQTTPSPTLVSLAELTPSGATSDADDTRSVLYQHLADDFLSRTPEARRQTLIIAHTHAERDAIAHTLRTARRHRRELPDDETLVPRLRAIDTTPAERGTMMPYQCGRVLSLHPRHYATIEEVDDHAGIVRLEPSDPKAPRVILPLKRRHEHTRLYALSTPPLSVGDWIVFRQTSRGDPWHANLRYVVQRISTAGIALRSEGGQAVTFDPFHLGQAHWDYDYTRTADMAQGMTVDSVLSVVRSKGALTSLRRAYVDISRARDHVCLYTDATAALVNTWLQQPDTSFSALETVDGTLPSLSVHFNDHSLLTEDPRFHNALGEYEVRRYLAYLQHLLPQFTESLAGCLFGDPNPNRTTPDWLVFGAQETATLVCLTGPNRGQVYELATGRTGSLLAALRQRTSLPETMLLAHLHQALFHDPLSSIAPHPQHQTRLTHPLPALPAWTRLTDTPSPLLDSQPDNELEGNGLALPAMRRHEPVPVLDNADWDLTQQTEHWRQLIHSACELGPPER